MKKLLLVLAVGAFVACNNGGSSTESTTDTTTKAPDTATMAPTPAAQDTAHKDTSAMKPADTSKVKK